MFRRSLAEERFVFVVAEVAFRLLFHFEYNQYFFFFLNPSQCLHTTAAAHAKAHPLFINGEFVESKSDRFFDVVNPATQEVVARTPLSTREEMERASEAAKVRGGSVCWENGREFFGL